MIATLLFVLCLWAIYTFVLDGIIAPTIHDHLQNRVYATRDVIRRMRQDQPEKINDAVFQVAESTANAAIRVIPIATIGMLVRARRRCERDAALSDSVAHDSRLISECELPISGAIAQLYYRITQAVVVNSSNWSVIVIPVFLIFKAVRKLSKLQWFFDQSHVLLRSYKVERVFWSDRMQTC